MNPRRKTTLEIRLVGDEVIVHDLDNAMVHVLNATAGDVLELCDGTRSIDEVAAALSKMTGVDAATIRPDIEAIVRTFTECGLFVTS